MTQWSQLPKRLLRFEISEVCNYNCCFCCWRCVQPISSSKIQHNAHFLLPEEYRALLEAAVETGCTRAMLTGGEPLLLPFDQLIAIVHHLTSVTGISDFWITTNGSILTPELCKQLVEAGLKKMAISIAAADEISYRLYSKQKRWRLDDVFRGVFASVQAGLHTKIDVPLSTAGISTYQDLLKLVDAVTELGVQEIAYFPLHETWENRNVFKALFVDAQLITAALEQSTRWHLDINSRGQTVFTDGTVDIIVPAKPMPIKASCQSLNCGHWCQGIYAAYVIFDSQRLYVRACHRTFGKRRNEFDVDRTRINDHNYLTDVFQSVWSFAYFDN